MVLSVFPGFSAVLLFGITPIAIAWIITRAKKKQFDMKYDIVMNAIDKGIPIDPKEILEPRKASTNKKNEYHLKTGIIECVVGMCLLLFNLLIILAVPERNGNNQIDTVRAVIIAICIAMMLLGLVLTAVGWGNIIIYRKNVPAPDSLKTNIDKLRSGIIECAIGLFFFLYNLLKLLLNDWDIIKDMAELQNNAIAPAALDAALDFAVVFMIGLTLMGLVLLAFGLGNIVSYIAYRKAGNDSGEVHN